MKISILNSILFCSEDSLETYQELIFSNQGYFQEINKILQDTTIYPNNSNDEKPAYIQ